MVRLKHRYLLVDILYPTKNASTRTLPQQDTDDFINFHSPSPSKVNDRDLSRLIRETVAEIFGDYGAGKIYGSLKSTYKHSHGMCLYSGVTTVVYFSTATSTAIIRVSRDHVRMLWAALSFVTRLPKPFEDACVINVVRNSGTIRLAEEEAIKRARQFVRRARNSSSANNSGLDQVLKHAVESEVRETGGGSAEDDAMLTDED